jgi:hypothetical protein
MNSSLVENDYVKIWEYEGIVYQVFKPKTSITIDVAKKVIEDRLKVSNGKAMPIYIDIRNVISVDYRAKDYLAGKEGSKLLTAGAFLLDNNIMRLLAKVFCYIDRPPVPARWFNERQKALQWLEKYKQPIS